MKRREARYKSNSMNDLPKQLFASIRLIQRQGPQATHGHALTLESLNTRSGDDITTPNACLGMYCGVCSELTRYFIVVRVDV